MNKKMKLASIAFGFAVLASSTAFAGVCQGTSTTWDQFIQGGCSGRGNWWGNMLGSNRRFATLALSGISTGIAALDSSGAGISGCSATDTTPGDSTYHYASNAACNAGVKYFYQANY